MFMQKIETCEACSKDFLYFGEDLHETEEHYFCSPDCIEKVAR
jgi:hypothetical protein